MSEQDELLLTEIKKMMDSVEPTHRLTCDDRDSIASQILAKVKQHYEAEIIRLSQVARGMGEIDGFNKGIEAKRLDRPDNVTNLDEFYEKYLPKYDKKYPITMRVTKEEERHILFHRGAMPFKKEVSNG